MKDGEFLAELRGQLMDGFDAAAADNASSDGDVASFDDQRQRRVRRTMFAAAAAVVAFAAFAGVFFTAGTKDVAAEVEAIIDDGWVQVRLVDLENRPEEIEEAAQSVGLDLEVNEVPVGPGQVGRFVSLAGTQVPPDLRRLGVDGSTFTGFRVPVGFDGSFTVNVGRPARPGEEWEATSPGSAALGDRCDELLGATVADAADIVGDTPARWFAAEPGLPPEEFTPGGSDFDDWVVFGVAASSGDEVWVQVSPDGSSPFPEGYPTQEETC